MDGLRFITIVEVKKYIFIIKRVSHRKKEKEKEKEKRKKKEKEKKRKKKKNFLGVIHSTKIPTAPTGKSGPPQKVDQFFQNFSVFTEPIHCVLDRNFRKFWLNGSCPA